MLLSFLPLSLDKNHTGTPTLSPPCKQWLDRFRTKSPAIHIIHEFFIHMPEYLALGTRSFYAHVYGRINVPAGAASCNRGDIIGRVCRQLGIVPRRLYLSDRALAFLHGSFRAIMEANREEDEEGDKKLQPGR
jgi:hypothetical protein